MEFLTPPPPPIRRLELDDPHPATEVARPAVAAPNGNGSARAAERVHHRPPLDRRAAVLDPAHGDRRRHGRLRAKAAVKGVSLPVRQGEVLSLIGPSGCGKTTLLRSLNRLTELTRTATSSGRILLDDVDIKRSSRPCCGAG